MSETIPANPHHHHTLHEVVDELRHKVSDATHNATHKLSDVTHKVGETFHAQHLALCTVCHAELDPEDVAQGCCSDKEGCSCRAFTARCW